MIDILPSATPCTCAEEHARINAGLLWRAQRARRYVQSLGRAKRTHWVEVCPRCDAMALCRHRHATPVPLRGWRDTHPRRFLSAPYRRGRRRGAIRFCGFHFSGIALRNSHRLIIDEDAHRGSGGDASTRTVSNLGARTLLGNARAARLYSAKLSALGVVVGAYGATCSVITATSSANDCIASCKPRRVHRMMTPPSRPWSNTDANAAIKGLGVSLASKHLRMLAPQGFAVLDDVLSQGLGFALNIKGYALFMRELRRFAAALPPGVLTFGTATVVQVESGIFGLLRQVVRSRDD